MNASGYEPFRNEAGELVCCFGHRGWGPSVKLDPDGDFVITDWSGDQVTIAQADIGSLLDALTSIRDAHPGIRQR
jgi:hypothetical protein